jgi:hypothetical protein
VQAKKKIKQTDAIFSRLQDLHAQTAEADNVLRLSLDTKATVKIGLFSREGDNWVQVNSDFIVDMLEHWWEGVRGRFPLIDTLLINQDNGPENHSRRTQFLKRIVAFGQAQQLTIRLASNPP